jgi:amino acid adenylation domain-containing protein
MDGPHLSQLLEKAATEHPHHVAVEDEHDRRLSYAELLRGADRLAARLARWGVDRGDRVGLWLNKSLEAVTSVHGILRTGASYVPVDPNGPALRAGDILATSGVKAVIVSAGLAPALSAVWPSAAPMPRLIAVGAGPDIHATPGAACDGDLVTGSYISPSAADVNWADVLADDAPAPLAWPRAADDLAYILFTSGSTGRPKGVMLSHRNAFTFLDWCHEVLGPWSTSDRFASHAPLHFDLSVFDLFATCRCAATLVLIGEKLGRDPVRLGEFLAKRQISVWYSAPSILALLARHGGLDRPAFPAPRKVLFAGEVFPIDALRALRSLWPGAAMWNLYGPTETNVCTAFPIPRAIPDDRTETYPIGRVCPPLSARVVDESGRDLPAGTIGELVIAGPGVMRGYFGQPELTSAAFFSDALGTSWYRTGDLVSDDGSGCYQFHGRRDRMVKKRGYRIELGEIESALHRYDGVDRAGVVAQADEVGVSIAAFVALKPNQKKSIIALKRHCTQYLPPYMIPDTITFLDHMPATSTDKVDYQSLKSLAAGEGLRP